MACFDRTQTSTRFPFQFPDDVRIFKETPLCAENRADGLREGQESSQLLYFHHLFKGTVSRNFGLSGPCVSEQKQFGKLVHFREVRNLRV